MALNIADLFEHAVDVVPERPVIQVGDRKVTYAELEADANRLAHFLAGRGVGPGDHVGIYAKNSVEHVVALLAVFKIRAVAINVNYRYVKNELQYLLADSGATALVYHAAFAPRLAEVLPDLPNLRVLIQIADDSGNPLLDGAVDYETVIADSAPEPPVQPTPATPEDPTPVEPSDPASPGEAEPPAPQPPTPDPGDPPISGR